MEDGLNFGLKFDEWGTGRSHFEATKHEGPCPECSGTGQLGSPFLPVVCPKCLGRKVIHT